MSRSEDEGTTSDDTSGNDGNSAEAARVGRDDGGVLVVVGGRCLESGDVLLLKIRAREDIENDASVKFEWKDIEKVRATHVDNVAVGDGERGVDLGDRISQLGGNLGVSGALLSGRVAACKRDYVRATKLMEMSDSFLKMDSL